MDLLSTRVKKILSVLMIAGLLLPPRGLWANTVAASAHAGMSLPAGAMVYPVQLNMTGLGGNALGNFSAPALSVDEPVRVAQASPLAVQSSVANTAVERHPIIEALNQLQRSGIVLPQTLDTPADVAKLRAVAQALPEGSARKSMLEFAQVLSSPKGGVPSATGRLFDNSGVKIVADGFMPVVQAAKTPGFLFRRLLGRHKKAVGIAPIGEEKFRVPVEKLRWTPKDSDLPASTAELADGPVGIIGQDRALKSILFGLKMEGPKYNVIVTGAEGSGRFTAVQNILGELAQTLPTPDDQAAVSAPGQEKLSVLRLPAGTAESVHVNFDKFLKAFSQALPQTLNAGPVARKKQQLQAAFQTEMSKRRAELDAELAKLRIGPENKYSVVVDIENSEKGAMILVMPALDGKPFDEKEIQERIDSGKLAKSEWDEVLKGIQEIAPKVIEQYQSLLMANDAEYQQVARQIAEIDSQVAVQLAEGLGREVLKPLVPQSKESAQAIAELKKSAQERQAALQAKYHGLQSGPFTVDIEAMPTPQGIVPVAMVNFQGLEVDEEGVQKLIADGKVKAEEFEALQANLQKIVPGYVEAFNEMMQQSQQELEALRAKTPKLPENVQAAVSELQRVIASVGEHYRSFLPIHTESPIQAEKLMEDRSAFHVDVLATNEPGSGAPAVFEPNPTYERLFGRAEGRNLMAQLAAGMMPSKGSGIPKLTPGAFHRANGGFLVLRLEDLLREPNAYPAVMKALRMGKASIAENGLEGFSFQGRSYAVPSSVKVILLGSPTLKMLLEYYDEDFRRYFGALAEFESRLDISAESVESYLSFIKNQVARGAGSLLEFSRGAIKLVLEQGAKLAVSNEKLSAQFGEVLKLLREASFWAKQAGHEDVEAGDVAKAVEERSEREGMQARHFGEYFARNVFFAATEGFVTGQINGLAVVGEDFGVPSRITVSVSAASRGGGSLSSWDRFAGTTGPTFDKALGVVNGFLSNLFGKNKPLPVDLTVSFEQQYGGIDGDSATSTEIYAALSALSGAPIDQGIAVTGSADQFGNVQAIGGQNDKIAGFFALAKSRGLNGRQGVIIPASNVPELMLKPEIVEAVREGKFHIWGVEHVSQAMEILTGKSYSEIVNKAKERLAKAR
ncbi:MAG: AAA family ATPase [Elusimicrobiota bacterium]